MLYFTVVLFILIIAGILCFVLRKTVGTSVTRTIVFWSIVGFLVLIIAIYAVNTFYKEEVQGGFETVEQALDYYDYGKSISITDIIENPTSAFVAYKSDSDGMAIMVFAKEDGEWRREFAPCIQKWDIHYSVYLFNINNTDEWYVYANCATLTDINGSEDVHDMYGSEFAVINFKKNSKRYLANVRMEQSVYTINIGNRTLEIDLTDK